MDFLVNKIKIKRLSATAHIPQKATPDSAGYDLYSDETILLPAKDYVAVSTGISMEMPSRLMQRVVNLNNHTTTVAAIYKHPCTRT